MQAHQLINDGTGLSNCQVTSTSDAGALQNSNARVTDQSDVDQLSTNQFIEDYLDTLFVSPLMPVFKEQIAGLRADARTRLKEIVRTNEETSSLRKTAVSDAIRQFGQSDAIAKELSHIRRFDEMLASRRSTVIATRSFSIAVAALATILIASGHSISGWEGQRQIFPLLFILVPAIAGLGVGLLSPARSVRATLAAILKTSIPAFACYLVWSNAQHFYNPWDAVQPLSFVHAVSWTAVGSLSAGIGSVIRKVNQRLRGDVAPKSRN